MPEPFKRRLKQPKPPRRPKQKSPPKSKSPPSRSYSTRPSSRPYDIDEEWGKIKRRKGIYEKITDRPTTSKEFKRRLASMATEAQQNAFRKKYPEFGPPKSSSPKVTEHKGVRGYLEDVKRSKTYDEFKFRRPDIVRKQKGMFGKNKGKDIPGLTKEGFSSLKKSGSLPVLMKPVGVRSVRRKKGSTVSRKGGRKIMQGYKAGGKV
jgi:hypothetical protein